jgi:pullulanase
MDPRFLFRLKAERDPTHVFQVSRDEQDSVTPQKGNEGMDFRFKKLAWYVMPSVVALALAGCGSDNNTIDNGGGAKTAKFELLVNTGAAAPAAKSSKASKEDFAAYNLYIWNTDDCTIAAKSVTKEWGDVTNQPTGVSERGNPTWDIPVTADAGCFNMIVREDTNGDKAVSDDEKRGSDRKMSITADNTNGMGWPTSNETYPSYTAAVDGLTGLSGASAHMVAADTLAWNKADSAKEVRLYHSATGGFKSNGTALPEGEFITLTPTDKNYDGDGDYMDGFKTFTLSTDDQAKLKNLVKEELVAVAVSTDNTVLATTQVQTAQLLDALFAEKAKALEYGAIVSDSGVTFRLWAPTAKSVSVVTYNADKSIAGTNAMSFDSDSGSWSYTGPTDLKGKFYRYQMEVFHPISRAVESYEVTDPYSLSLAMNSEYSQVIDLEDPDLKPEGWDTLKAPHTQLDNPAKIVTLETHIRDFSAMDQSTPAEHRGKYLAFTDTNSVPVKHMKELAENGVTHMHLMPTFDIATVNEDPTKVANLSDPFSKLCAVNPSVKESKFKDKCDSSETIEATLESLQTEDSKTNPVIQELYGYIRGVDSFNWGYDPFHYTVPEGSYATDDAVDGTARIKQFREMVQSIKQNIGMNVVMDVVYNHTNASGPTSKYSVLDKIVPWYYQRLNEVSGNVETSTCCSNTAPEHAMFAKLIEDSLATWTKEYKIDAFRFDLMGFHPLAQSTKALEKTRAINPDMFFYAEGWDFGETAKDRRFVTTTQPNTGGTGISTYSDRLRDAVRGGSPFDSGDGIRKTQGFGNGAYVTPNESVTVDDDLLSSALHQSDLTMLGMAGNLKAFTLLDKDGLFTAGSKMDYNGQKAGYAVEPWEVLNYVTKHDNQTIWDNINYKVAADVSLQDRVKMQAVSIATAMLGQGIPFTDIGSELLRSKSFERDSYDSGDWYNKVDYTLEDNNFNKGYPRSDKDAANYDLIAKVLKPEMKPTKADMQQMVSYFEELTRLRKDNPLLTLGKGDEVVKRVDFRNVGPDQVPGLIVMSIDDGVSAGADMDPANDAAVVIINATPDTQTVGNFKDGKDQAITLNGFQLSAAHSSVNSIAGDASFSSGEFTVPAWSAAVFVKPQGAERGTGLPISKKQDLATIEPFDVPVYLPGKLIGDWNFSDANKFVFTGADYSYSLSTEVTDEFVGDGSKTVEFKVADDAWGDADKGGQANYGICTEGAKLTTDTPLALCTGSKAKGNIALAVTQAGTYQFSLKVIDKDNPTLTLAIKTDNNCKLLADSPDAAPLGATKLALRGSHSAWGFSADYQFSYKGNGIYQAKVTGPVDMSDAAHDYDGFKVADDSDSWSTQLIAADKGTVIKPLELDTNYELYGRTGGTTDLAKNTMNLGAGEYVFQVKFDSVPTATPATVGTMNVCQMAQ